VEHLGIGPLKVSGQPRKRQHKPINPHHSDLNVYHCPVCTRIMERTEEYDRIDHFGINAYHSMDLRLECGHCPGGFQVTINMPYKD